MHTETVNLKENSYPILIGEGLTNSPDLIADYIVGNDVLIVTNEVVAPLYLEKITKLFDDKNCLSYVLPDGEEQKKLKEVIKKTEEEVDVQKSEVDLANRAKRSGEEAAKKEKEGITKLLEAKAEEKMKGKMIKLAKQVEKEKGVNKKFERERGVLMKELSRLRMDTGSADNLKKKIDYL